MRLSKFMSYALRHQPQKFGLEPDAYGFVRVPNLLTVLRDRYGDLETSDLERAVQDCPKRRFEIRGEKIRARYGHSVDVMLDAQPCRPPELLFHGTSPAMKDSILEEGIKPMKRKYVHLSKTTEEAFQVGGRRSKNPVVFAVKAEEAHGKGIKFYDMGLVVLTAEVPARFVRFADE
ncbi:MAG: RNA 2'-phosphotransferase [Candidatus Zixiibacteriota bacterium]|nr:MAG: RNA 2'-phosphotransferase [candidate division Zixibacteria bacterium]